MTRESLSYTSVDGPDRIVVALSTATAPVEVRVPCACAVLHGCATVE
ncbi:hypothetical protein [Saccharothrix sp. Mg75]